MELGVIIIWLVKGVLRVVGSTVCVGRWKESCQMLIGFQDYQKERKMLLIDTRRLPSSVMDQATVSRQSLSQASVERTEKLDKLSENL